MSLMTYQTERTYVSIFDWYKGYIDKIPEGFCGRIGFNRGAPDKDGSVEIFYEIVPAFRRQGLMQEVIVGLLYELQENHSNEVEEITARAQFTNVPSINLLHKLGFCPYLPMYPEQHMRYFRRQSRDVIPFDDTRIVYHADDASDSRCNQSIQSR
jgi:RimJ/RimL family protein N-acetyltransferase